MVAVTEEVSRLTNGVPWEDASQYSCPPQVLRRRLKKSNKHTNADVLMNYGHQCANFSESKMRVMCLKLDEERQEIRTWATNEVKMRMLKSAIMCGMRFGPEMSIVRHFNDIYTSWTEDSSDTNARRMYSVLYGNFEGKNANWSQVLEGEFMSRMGREYIPELNEGKVKTMGCYEKQISGCKSTQVKLLNRTDAGGERGKCIQMSYPGKNKGVENSRRKAGDFFVKDLKTDTWTKMSAHQVDLVEGADNVSEDDDDKTVSVHGDEQPPIDIDELNMKPQARKKNPGSERNSLVSNFQRNQRAKDEREMCELRARQAERYKREEDKLSNAGEGKANLGNEDGSESGSDNEMVYGNWLEKENEKVRIKIEGEERKPQNDAKLVHKSQVTKPRHRGAVVGNGSTMRLEEGQKVGSPEDPKAAEKTAIQPGAKSKTKKDPLKTLQQLVMKNQDFAERKQRKEDEEHEKRRSDENRKLIEKGKKKAKPRKENQTKAVNKRNGDEILDVAEWNILGRYLDRRGPMFEVDMTGVEKEVGDDGQYATREDLVKDGAGALVDDYIRENCNFSPWNDQLTGTKGGGGDTTTPKKKAKRKVTESMWEQGEKLEKASNTMSSECRHDVFQLLVTYVPEENPGYCKSGYYLHNKKCASCSRAFVADEKTLDQTGDAMCFKASSDTPIYCCVNVRGGGGSSNDAESGNCGHLLCSDCWKIGILKEEPGRNKRARSSRTGGG